MERSTSSKQVARWCFTLNNPDENKNLSWPDKVRYAIYSLETGESGTRHYQGYLELKHSARLSTVRKLVPGAHFEPAKGTPDQNIKYCSKAPLAGPYEHGTRPRPGRRTDLEAVTTDIKAGKSIADIAATHTEAFIRFPSGIVKASSLLAPKRDFKTEVFIICGPTGTGKTAFATRKPSTFVVTSDMGDFWEGYTGQENCVLDEMRGSVVKYSKLLQLMDRYPTTVNIKHGSQNFVSRRLYLTSNVIPTSWYPKRLHEPVERAAFERRIEHFWIMPVLGSIIHCRDLSHLESLLPIFMTMPTAPPTAGLTLSHWDVSAITADNDPAHAFSTIPVSPSPPQSPTISTDGSDNVIDFE